MCVWGRVKGSGFKVWGLGFRVWPQPMLQAQDIVFVNRVAMHGGFLLPHRSNNSCSGTTCQGTVASIASGAIIVASLPFSAQGDHEIRIGAVWVIMQSIAQPPHPTTRCIDLAWTLQ